MKNQLIVLAVLFIVTLNGFSQLTSDQKIQVDSLKSIVNNSSSHDTSMVSAYVMLSEILYLSNIDTIKILSNKAITLANQSLQKTSNEVEIKSLKKYLATAMNNLGFYYQNTGEIEKSLNYYNQAIEIHLAIKNFPEVALTYNNIAIVYMNKGQNEKAVKYNIKSLNIQKEIGNKKGIAMSLNNIGLIYYNQGDLDQALTYYYKSLKIQKEIDDKHGLALCYNNIGFAYKLQGRIEGALDFLHKALKIYEDIGNDQGVANSYNNMGLIYYNQGQIQKCIEYYSKSLKIYEKIGDKSGLAISLNNIGLVYKDQGEYDKSLTYHFKSLKIQEEIGSKSGIANSFNGIGFIYMSKGEMEKSLEYYNKALNIREEINDKKGMGMTLNNLAMFYQELGDNEKSLEFNLRALKVREEIEDKSGISNSLNNIGAHYFREDKLNIAKGYLQKGLILAQELGFPERIMQTTSYLYKINEKEGNWFEAYDKYKLYISMRDSINNEDTYKATIKQNAQYEYEKQAAADSILNAEAAKITEANLAAEKAENRRQQQQKYYLFGGLSLALIFGAVVFNRFRTTKKQKVIIEKQKGTVDKAFEELEEKNTEILDSINYAKRIQSAILPPQKLVKKYIPESFILYKPKDIVAGDFYWMEPQEDGVIFAAADCTGHGVPGAMVSVVCNNGLNRSVREYGLTEPAKILDKTREIVIAEFEKSEEDVKDGMDIALCALEGSKLHYAGAHNPLWIICTKERHPELVEGISGQTDKKLISVFEEPGSENVLVEIKADKQPIGKFGAEQPFTNHIVELQKGDSIYIFSDGYADQFGGEKGKKFKSKNFKKLLLSVQNETMERQRQIIDEAFEEWKMDLEQLDDVCVIGVRL